MTTPTIQTRELASDLKSEVCGIPTQSCRRQVSRYTCPSCNLSYCSLSCFRSEAHSRCSEVFYRKEIEIGIKSGPSRSDKDRKKTLELLKRIEDQSAVDQDWLYHSDEEENEEESLASRLSAIDISSASADELLRLLTKQERDKFFSVVKNPSGVLAQELLETTELEKTRQLPWWEATNDGVNQSPLSAHVVEPDVISVPTDLVKQAARGISLLYNLCAIIIAYVYVTRRLSMSPLASTRNDLQDQCEARRILSQLTPFLVDHRSKLRHVSLADAVISFWSRLEPGSIDSSSMCVLLGDVGKLVRPRRVTVVEHSLGERESITGSAGHPLATTIMVISDISSLFDAAVDSLAIDGHRCNHIIMKLTFYAAHVLATPPSRLHVLADEVDLFSKRLDEEARTST